MKTRGMGRVFQRNKIWWLQYSADGVQHRESSHSESQGDAVKLLKRRIADAQAGKRVGAAVERLTLDGLLEMVDNDYRANGRRSLKRVYFAALPLRRFFGGERKARRNYQ